MTGTSIWINQTGSSTATISGNTTIGSLASPVILVVDGNLSLSGNVTIYGFVFVIGTNDITGVSGNANIIGGLATTDTLTMSGNTNVQYTPSIFTSLLTMPSMNYYAKVPGSWKDF
jgi:hypothetical protein